MRLHPLKKTPKQPAIAALHPRSAMASLRYRIEGLLDTSAPRLPSALEATLEPAKNNAFRHLSFTFAAIALSAQVARADGRVSHEEYAAFREAFPLWGGVCGKIRRLFMLACEDTMPPAHYAAQIRQLFPNRPGLLASLMERLFRVAGADGGIGREKERLLSEIAHGLGVSAGDYAAIRTRHLRPPAAHDVLEVDRNAPAAVVKKRYHALMRDTHPDHFFSLHPSPEVELLLKLRAAEVNAAYRRLSKRVA